eukprot:10821080-Karenia_brevis.AAC.1
MPSNYSNIMMTYPTHQVLQSQPMLRNMIIFERLDRAIDMGNTRYEYTLPSGEDIHTYMPTESLLYNYDKTLDKPERVLNQRFMRRIGDTATETCTYSD